MQDYIQGRRRRRPNLARGFTLIELLVVIAIILILIAIALPNFLEAQIRAKVAKASADLRTVSTALYSYYLDFGIFPGDHDPTDYSQKGLFQLTSPIAYLTQLPTQTFTDQSSGLGDPLDDEFGLEMGSTGLRPLTASLGLKPPFNINAYVVYNYGPDAFDNVSANDRWPFPRSPSGCGDSFLTSYSATNGTKSLGDILEFGGEHRNGRYCLDGVIIVGKGNEFTGDVPE